jgi:hypothetical protein
VLERDLGTPKETRDLFGATIGKFGAATGRVTIRVVILDEHMEGVCRALQSTSER